MPKEKRPKIWKAPNDGPANARKRPVRLSVKQEQAIYRALVVWRMGTSAKFKSLNDVANHFRINQKALLNMYERRKWGSEIDQLLAEANFKPPTHEELKAEISAAVLSFSEQMAEDAEVIRRSSAKIARKVLTHAEERSPGYLLKNAANIEKTLKVGQVSTTTWNQDEEVKGPTGARLFVNLISGNFQVLSEPEKAALTVESA